MMISNDKTSARCVISLSLSLFNNSFSFSLSLFIIKLSFYAVVGSMRKRSSCFCVGNFTLVAKPNFFNPQIKYHVMSTCHHSNPCLALNSNAW